MQRILLLSVTLVTISLVLVGWVRKEEHRFYDTVARIERDIETLHQVAAIDSQIAAVKDRLSLTGGDTALTVPIYRAHIKHGQSPDLLMAVIATESGYRKDAVSEKGAQGIMQIMPATAELFLPLMGKVDYDPFDPADNIDLGAFYLSCAMEQYRGDVSLVLAEYHGGPSGAKHYRQSRLDKIPKTARYVKKVEKSYWALKEL